jgi:mRNA interferase MazF
VIKRGELWWASLPDPRGSESGYRRPVLVIQSDAFNRSGIGTVLVAVVTSNVRLGDAPGNVPLTRKQSGLSKPSVVNVSQLVTLDRRYLTERIGRAPTAQMEKVEHGLRLVLSLRES